jgi:hypothetical protein
MTEAPTSVLALGASKVLQALAGKDYTGALAHCARSRLSAADLQTVIEDYGRSVVLPPKDVHEFVDAVRVVGADKSTWSVRVPLWTLEEGRSDLTLELTIRITESGVLIDLDDLHVP